MDARQQVQPATHVIRLLGLIGTADEMYQIQAALNAGGNAAKRLLTKKLEDLVVALNAYCSIVVTQNAPASSGYNAGTEVNALSDYMGRQDTGDDVAKTIDATTATTATDPAYN